jgi:serine/threonine protein kinase
MSVTILDPAHPSRERSATWGPPTEDLESTTDVHEEHTTDLAPRTEDVKSAPEDVAVALPPQPVDDTPIPEPASRESAESHPTGSDAASPVPDPAAPSNIDRPYPEKRSAKPRAIAVGPGTVLCDRYLIEQMIGRGGTAVVFRARDMLSSSGTEPNRQVAIKMPRPELTDRQRAVTRLRHEFEHATRLSHPNIVRVMEFHDDPAHCFIAMELVEGRLLSILVRDWTMLSPPLTQKILNDCAQALMHAHSHGVVHGDFKPGNVFVTADDQIKVLDFGASALTSGPDDSRIAAGTPAYASPEVLSGATPEPRDDVFSFACVAYELLTGQHPFERYSSLRARSEGLVPQRPWSLSAPQWLALLSALSWERTQRPADMETLMAALTADSPMPSPAPSVPAEDTTAPVRPLRTDLMPRPSSWGFFVFIACAVAVIVIAIQRPRQTPLPSAVNEASKVAAMATPAPAPAQTTPPASAPQTQKAGASQGPAANAAASTAPKPAKASPVTTRGGSKTTPPAAAAAAEIAPAQGAAATAKAPASTRAAALSQVSFENRTIITSESSVAAVFLIKRSQPLNGRVRVSWVAESGTADAGIDFASNARGTIEFADGQAQRAIYVPLRNDLLKEGDETFSVRLLSPQGAKLGAIASAEAIIRDDD